MPSIYDPEVRDELLRRVDALTPDSSPRWGGMSAPEVVCHLNAGLRAGLGELPVQPVAGPMSRFPLNWLIIHVVPWPRAKAASPREFLGTPAGGWDADVASLRSLIGRVSAAGPNGPSPASAVFGRISGKTWGVLHWKHVDHHLRQFGA